MKKSLRLRAPLVVTALAGAALSACGGAVVTPTPVCPADPPAAGAACDPLTARGGTCGYGSCQGRPITQATCDPQARTWAVSTSRCDVPVPMRACPTAQPANGDRCDATRDPASCNYGWSDCLRGPAVTARCEADTWRLAVATCNPPAPTCPVTPPNTDDPCVSSLSCEYGDCAGAPTTFARCESGRWQVAMASCNPPPPMPTCPPTAPQPGTPCTLPNGAPPCRWGSCDTASSYPAAVCLDGRWALQTIACEPTPVMPCPSTPPIAGDRCAHPPSATCDYGRCASTPAVTYACVGGAWSVSRAMCGDYCPPSRPLAGSACSRDAVEPCRYPGVVCNGTQLTNEAACNPMTHRWVITEFICR